MANCYFHPDRKATHNADAGYNLCDECKRARDRVTNKTTGAGIG